MDSIVKKLTGILVLAAVSTLAVGQTTTEKKAAVRPDIPGIFTVEFGFNRDIGGPSEFELGFFGSRTANIYYQYDFRLFNSPFSIVPGVGLSLERFAFKNDYTIQDSDGNISMLAPTATGAYPGIKRSLLVTNYIDVPVEIRYTVNADDPTRSFKVGVGGRIGYMYDSFAKIKYSENSQTKLIKDKQDYNLNKVRYGLIGRMGFGNVTFFGYYNLSPLFEKGKGLQTNNVSNDFNTWTVGISLASF